ncbi:MAG: hypothetical protein K6B40_02865 [Firmicutes bacterium]|nr:hypothetical protein [Bacillota bacterium]
MEKKETMNIGRQIFLGNTLVGVIWLGAGFVGFFNGVLAGILEMIFMLVGIILISYCFFSEKEKSDEMADENLIQAGALSGDVIYLFWSLVAIVLILIPKIPGTESWNWPKIIKQFAFIAIGLQNLIKGIIFKRLEA